MREGGEAAVERALAWLADAIAGRRWSRASSRGGRHAAFNITVFSQLLGTPLEPDLAGHVLMLEEVSEHMYRTDRAMFHITGNAACAASPASGSAACSDVPDNDPDFGENEEEVVRYWCERAGIPYLGRADIGHDSANKVVPFGLLLSLAASLKHLSTENAPNWRQIAADFALSPHCQSSGFALYRPHQHHREGRMAQGRQSGLQRPVKPSADLAAITGSDPLPRSQVVSKIWDHIRKNNLQNPQNKREILADDKLKKIFGKDRCSMFEMNKHLSRHLS